MFSNLAPRRLALAGLFGLGLAAAFLPAAAAAVTRTFERVVALEPSQALRLDLRYGEIHVECGEADQVELELRVRCTSRREKCDERLAAVELACEPHGRTLEVRVDGLRRFSTHSTHVELWVRVPPDRPLDIDLGAGEVRVTGLERDLRVHLGAGSIQVRMPEAAVHSVDARAGVGEASLSGRRVRVEERRHLVGGVAHWSGGPGEARVDCQVGAGEVAVRLE